MLVTMVRMIIHISRQLFPTSHILREDVVRDVEVIAKDTCDFLDLVLERLEQRLDAARSAHAELSEQVQDVMPLEEIGKWVDMIK
jgi:hypothetical protein